MTLIDDIRRAKESGGNRVAMIAGDRRWTYDEFEYSINHSGCRVCISQSDLYANVVPIRSALTTLEHVFLVDGDESRFLNVRSINELLDRPARKSSFPEIPDDAVAAILYTSGTTSRPKGATGKVHRRSLREQAKTERMERRNRFQ